MMYMLYAVDAVHMYYICTCARSYVTNAYFLLDSTFNLGLYDTAQTKTYLGKVYPPIDAVFLHGVTIILFCCRHYCAY